MPRDLVRLMVTSPLVPCPWTSGVTLTAWRRCRGVGEPLPPPAVVVGETRACAVLLTGSAAGEVRVISTLRLAAWPRPVVSLTRGSLSPLPVVRFPALSSEG